MPANPPTVIGSARLGLTIFQYRESLQFRKYLERLSNGTEAFCYHFSPQVDGGRGVYAVDIVVLGFNSHMW